MTKARLAIDQIDRVTFICFYSYFQWIQVLSVISLYLIAVIEKTLLDTANCKFLVIFHNILKYTMADTDIMRLKIQMLPDLIHTRNGKVAGAPPIVQVTNDRTLCDVTNEVSTSKECSPR